MANFKEKGICPNLQLIEKLRKDLSGPLSKSEWEHEKSFLNYILIFLFWRFSSENLCIYINENQRKEYLKRGIKKTFNYEDATEFSKEALNNCKNNLKKEGFYYFLTPNQLFINVSKDISYKGRGGLSNKVDEILKECIWRPQCIEYINKFTKDTIYRDYKNRIDKDIDLTTSNSPLGDSSISRDEWVEKFIRTIQGLQLDISSSNSFSNLSQSLIRKYFLFACTGDREIQENISRLCIEITKQIFPEEKILNVCDIACNGGNFLIQLRKEFEFNISCAFERNKENILFTLINLWINDLSLKHFFLKNPLSENRDWEEKFDLFLANDSYPKQGIKDFQKEKEKINESHIKFDRCALTRPCWAHALHSLHKLSLRGVCFLMATCDDLSRTGIGDEKNTRMYFLSQGYIETIIMLPREADRLRQGSNQGKVHPHLLIFRRNRPEESPIFFINATKEEIDSQGHLNLEKILEVYKTKKEIKGFSHFIPFEQIKNKDYALTWKRFFKFVPENEKDSEFVADEDESFAENKLVDLPDSHWTEEELHLYKNALPKSTEKQNSNFTKIVKPSMQKQSHTTSYQFSIKQELNSVKNVVSRAKETDKFVLREGIQAKIKPQINSVRDNNDYHWKYRPQSTNSKPAPKQINNSFLRENIQTKVKSQSYARYNPYSTIEQNIQNPSPQKRLLEEERTKPRDEVIEIGIIEDAGEDAPVKAVKEKKKRFFSWFRKN